MRRRPFLTRLATLALTLSLALQLLVLPYHRAAAARELSASGAGIAAELNALFGAGATLCVGADEKGAPGPPAGGCEEHCPFCRFAADAGALVPPNAPALPNRFGAARAADGCVRAEAETASALGRPKARAPPVAR